MAYEKIVSVPSTATSGQVPQADGAGGFDWGAVDAYTKAQTLTEATKIAYGLDASAVPDDVFNAVKGLLGGGVKIATGSYVGTGIYGASNPCSLTFDFVPKLVAIGGKSTNSGITTSVIIAGMKSFSNVTSDYGGARFSIIWDNQTVSWYSSNVTEQQNIADEVYQYIAFG